VEDAIRLFHGDENLPADRMRAQELLLASLRKEESPLARFYLAECQRANAAQDAPLAAEMYDNYHSAATAGLSEAAFRIGVCLETGFGVPRDIVQAMNWYRLAGEEGLAPAQLALASAYHHGHGVPRSDFAACSWLFLADGFQEPGLSNLRRGIVGALSSAEIDRAIATAPSLVSYPVTVSSQ
jgi:TPR repeat protein